MSDGNGLAEALLGLVFGGGTSLKSTAVFDVTRAELRVADLHSRLRLLLDELEAP